MNKLYIPEGYRPVLDAYDTQRAIAYIKRSFQDEFAGALNLKRVSAPLFVTEDSGLNDNLNGYERPVSFDVPAVGKDAQVVAIHAGLECGLLGQKLPGLDCVSIGPEMHDIHTSRERLGIASVKRTWKFILEVLKEI